MTSPLTTANLLGKYMYQIDVVLTKPSKRKDVYGHSPLNVASCTLASLKGLSLGGLKAGVVEPDDNILELPQVRWVHVRELDRVCGHGRVCAGLEFDNRGSGHQGRREEEDCLQADGLHFDRMSEDFQRLCVLTNMSVESA